VRDLKAAQEAARYEVMSEKDLAREIKRLEKAMQEHAKNLEFEEAAAARDELFRVKHLAFGGEAHDAPGMRHDRAGAFRLHRQHLPIADGGRRGTRPGAKAWRGGGFRVRFGGHPRLPRRRHARSAHRRRARQSAATTSRTCGRGA
jgi:hypothetical protein